MMKNFLKKLYSFSNLLIVMQLSFSPLVMANEGVGREENNWMKSANALAFLAQATQQGVSAYTQARQQPNQNMCNGIQRDLALQPIDSRQVPTVFNGCMVLPAKGNRLSSALSCGGASHEQVMGGYADCIIQVAENNLNELSNFQTKGHERFTTQGVGCYEKKIEDFETLLKFREEELSKYENNLEKLYETLLTRVEGPLENVKKTEAILNGGPLAKEYLRDFKFENVFLGANDGGVCGSVLAANDFTQMGQKGGLRAIEEKLAQTADDSSGAGNNRSLSAKELISRSTQGQIKKEIQSIARRLGDSVANQSGPISVKGLSISSRTNLINANSKAIQNAMKVVDEQIQTKIQDLRVSSKVKVAIDSDPNIQSVFTKIESGEYDNSDVKNALRDYENKTKKSCLNKLIETNGGSVAALARKFRNPNVSKRMADEADNGLANAIQDAFDQYQSIDGIKRAISQAEKSNRLYSKYIMTTGKSFTVGAKSFSASTPLRASQFFGMLIDNCNQRYKSQDIKNGYSNADIAKAASTFGTAYNKLRKTAKSTLRNTLVSELISCKDNTSTGTAAMSCDPKNGAMNMDNEAFCLRTAVKCASNINACGQKAIAEVKKVKESQTKNIETYNDEVKLFRNTLKTELAAIEKFMETQARSLDAQLNIGSVFNVAASDSSSKDQAPNIFLGSNGAKAQGQMFADIDPELKLHDPKAYLDQVKGRVADLKKQAEEQRVEQIAKLNKLKGEYVTNYKSEEQNWQSVIQECVSRNAAADKQVADQNDLIKENDELISSACQELVAYNKGEEVEVKQLRADLDKAVGLAAASAPGYSALSTNDKAQINRIIKRDCNASSDEKGSLIAKSLKSNNSVTITQLCATDSPYLSTYNEDIKKSIQGLCKNRLSPDQCGKSASDVVKGVAEDDKFGTYKEYQTANNCYLNIDKGSLKEELEKKSKEARDQLFEIATAVACENEKSNLGQVKVSVCDNAGLSEVNSKGMMGQDVARDLATALGQASALSQ